MMDLPSPDPAIEIIVASRGVSKGLAQTDGPQVVVRPEIAFGPVYLAGYAKNVTSPTSDGEAGASLGIRAQASGLELAASATYKRSIAPVGAIDGEALELAGSASRRFGPTTLRVSVVWSPDDLGSTGRTVFAEGSVGHALGGRSAISASLGRRTRDGGPDYTGYSIGVTHTLATGVSADLRWYDTDRSGIGDAYESRLIASLRLRF